VGESQFKKGNIIRVKSEQIIQGKKEFFVWREIGL
jgi:hypothetical protein